MPLANLSRARLVVWVVFLEFRDRYLSDFHTWNAFALPSRKYLRETFYYHFRLESLYPKALSLDMFLIDLEE